MRNWKARTQVAVAALAVAVGLAPTAALPAVAQQVTASAHHAKDDARAGEPTGSRVHHHSVVAMHHHSRHHHSLHHHSGVARHHHKKAHKTHHAKWPTAPKAPATGSESKTTGR